MLGMKTWGSAEQWGIYRVKECPQMLLTARGRIVLECTGEVHYGGESKGAKNVPTSFEWFFISQPPADVFVEMCEWVL